MEGYIGMFSGDVRERLEKIRRTIKEVVPDATETISYQIPTFKLNGRYVIYFAGWSKHIALYPIPAGTAAFKKEIAQFVVSKGTIRFPLDKPVPYGLIKKIVKFLVKDNLKNG